MKIYFSQTFKLTYFILFTFFISITGCLKDGISENSSTTNLDSDDIAINLEGDLQISDFVWQGLNFFYYWQGSVDNLSDSKLNDSKLYSQFINDHPDPDEFFNYLTHPDDRFSWIQENYEDLENSLAGVFSSNGVEFSLLRFSNESNQVIGFVKYILENSYASEKKIQRGDFFYGVNGQTLTTENYRNLLYGDNLEYTLNMADIENQSINPNGINIELVKEENFETNPIQIEKVLDINSNKIGYLMYNQFVSDKATNLNEAFGRFKNEGISDLVLDLRYNGGGSVFTCIALASMITGQFNGKVFSKEIWNTKLLKYWQENNPARLEDRFNNTLNDIPINSLNLSRVYIITTSDTASASELLINGLRPYIDVVQIGEKTVGKNLSSITVYDYIDNDGTKNPDHKYAMQPIVLKNANSEGFADYSDGLVPNITIEEDLKNSGILGDEMEPMLSSVINLISGSGKISNRKAERNRSLLITDPKTKRLQRMFVKYDYRENSN